jgi:N-dimethylarginine dimethylaminohydrolase
MSFDFGQFNEWSPISTVAMRRPREAFVSDTKIDAEWRDLNYHSRPSLPNASLEYQHFEKLLTEHGANILELPSAGQLTLDAIYTRDSLIVTPKGLVLPRMGKAQRRAESSVNATALKEFGLPIAGELTGDAKLEGGDLVWLDRNNLIAGLGYRTNAEGIRQLQAIIGQDVTIHWFDLPHYKGQSDVFHLMSVLSPVDRDLAVVYQPLTPARLVEFLKAWHFKFVDVPDDEFESMGCNVLAIAPRVAIMVEGNPETARRLRSAGVTTHEIAAQDISRKGEGGPTCLTRPLSRG